MITRLKVNGFKNLNQVDVRFGPFTCIAGTNAVGKSNLFDAIRFLSELTWKSLHDAARSVRSEGQKASDVRDIFYKSRDTYADLIEFEVDMIIPEEANDELGQKAKASIRTVRYILKLRCRQEDEDQYLEIDTEELLPITQTEAKRALYFENSGKWRKSVINGVRRSGAAFISTIDKEESNEGDIPKVIRTVRLHMDQEKGKPFDRISSKLPRTVLSTLTAEYPTALVTQQEMRLWIMLQLEPTALRRSDDFEKRKHARLEANGAHIPATVSRIQSENIDQDIYQQLANRLTELVEDIREIKIDKDDKRELLTIMVRFKDGNFFPARSLSDGTLRFLGLAVLEKDVNSGNVICLEEPENGIHPEKIGAILQLLQDIAVDPNQPEEKNNPLRQVILNTHSPLVVQQVPEDSLLMATGAEIYSQITQNKQKTVRFTPLQGTWRTKTPENENMSASLGNLLVYLGSPSSLEISHLSRPSRKNRVIDRQDVKQLLLPFSL